MDGSEADNYCDSPLRSNLKRARVAEDEDFVQLHSERGVPVVDAVQQVQEDFILPSVEDLLSVPTEFIFRKVPSTSSNNAEGSATISVSSALKQVQQKPLLSRSEAQCFCKINLLAHEIDCLTQICAQIWQTQLHSQSFSQSLEAVDHPYLRPLVVLLDTFAQQTPSWAMPQIALELNRVVSELQQATVTLRQCSEQNWALAESLQDAATAGHLLALEKQKLSDIQEEICHRIDHLIVSRQANTNSNSGIDFTMDAIGSEDQCSNMSTGTSRRGSTGPLLSMHEYCSRIFAAAESDMPATRKAIDGDDKDEILSEPEDDPPHKTPSPPPQKSTTFQSAPLFSHSTMSSTPQATTQSHVKDLSKSQDGSEGKENSQQSQRSSQSATASNHRPSGITIESIVMATSTSHAMGELMSGDEYDHHGADSQAAAQILSALAVATTLDRANDSCGALARSSPSDRF